MEFLAVDRELALIDFVDTEQQFCSFRAPRA
jgi:hypothetical protein